MRIKALDGSEKLGLAERSAQVTWGLTTLEMSLISPVLFLQYICLLHRRCGACSVEILVQLERRGQERLAVAEGGHTQLGRPIPHRKLGSLVPKGGKRLLQREGLWLWPSSTLSVIVVVWKTPIRILSALSYLCTIFDNGPRFHLATNRGRDPDKYSFSMAEGTKHSF